MASDHTDDEPGEGHILGDSELSIDAPGISEVAVVPWALLWRERVGPKIESHDRYPWFVVVAALFGLFSVGFTITILSNSLNVIATDLGAPVSMMTWVITGPILAFAVLGPAAGKFGDVAGSRRVYLWSLFGVAVFAGLTAMAWSGWSLVVFRVLGAGVGAATGPASLAMINKMFPRERRAQALGYWSLVAAGGPVIGVVIGGPIVETYGWRWIFIMQVPMTLVSLAVGFFVLPETDRHERTPFDAVGSVLLGLSVGAALVGLNRGPSLGWSSPFVAGMFLLSLGFAVAFVQVERTTDHPLIPLPYFRRRNFAFPIVNQFFTNFAYMGGFILTPFLLQNVLGYGPTHSGLLSIARPLAFSIAGPIAGYTTVKIGERTNAVAGALFIVASMVALSRVGVGTSDLVIMGALALSGVGMGAASPALAAAIANSVEEKDLGVVSAAQQMVAQIGVVAGIQILLTVQVSQEPNVGAAASYHIAYLVGAGVALVGALLALFVHNTRKQAILAERRSQAERGRGAPQGASSITA
ncbi:MAG: MFS transporter [Actinomycetes bacterium]